MRSDPECRRYDIAAFVDGDLDTLSEAELERHIAQCQMCTEELNLQKQFLCGLNSSLRNEAVFDLPSDFAKRVVVNAESTVVGLRKPREQFNAIFICVALLFFVLLAIGPDASNVFNGLASLVDQTSAVGGFFGHIVYSVFIGLAIILRSFASRMQVDGVSAIAFTLIITLCLVAVLGRGSISRQAGVADS